MWSDVDLTQGTPCGSVEPSSGAPTTTAVASRDRESRRAASDAVPTAPSDATGGTQLADQDERLTAHHRPPVTKLNGRLGSLVSVVGGLEGGRWDVAALLVEPAVTVAESHPADALVCAELVPSQATSSLHSRAFVRHDALINTSGPWIQAEPLLVCSTSDELTPIGSARGAVESGTHPQ